MKKIDKMLKPEMRCSCRFKKFFTEQRCRYKKIFFEGDENSVHGDVVEYEHPRDAAECHKLQVFFFPQTGPK